ncbi:sodium-dependent transporter, partial [Microbacterium keratanolyticum]
VLVLWVLRRGGELRAHLSAVSTFRVGAIWQTLVTVLAPIVLGYMLITQIVTLVTDGYGGMPAWYLLIFGWGTIALIIVLALVLTLTPWRQSPDDFRAWPPYEPSERSRPRSEVKR